MAKQRKSLPSGLHPQLSGDPSADPKAAREVHTELVPGAVYVNALSRELEPLFAGTDLGPSGMLFVRDLLARMKPRDAAEELLIAQLVMTHTRVLNLTALASKQSSIEAIRIINEYADRASNTYRRQMLALAEYRRPPRGGDSFTAIKQANIAQQQVVMNGDSNGKENATNEQGLDCTNPAEAGRPDLPAQLGRAGIPESVGAAEQALGAVHGAEDGKR